jgi:hypothetical protein
MSNLDESVETSNAIVESRTVIHASGADIVIDVRVVTRASRPGIAGSREGALVVRLQSAPIENAANEELVERLAEALRVPKRAVWISGGQHSRTKRVTVTGMDIETGRARLGLAP